MNRSLRCLYVCGLSVLTSCRVGPASSTDRRELSHSPNSANASTRQSSNGSSSLGSGSCELVSEFEKERVPLSVAAKRKLAQMVMSATRLSDEKQKEISSIVGPAAVFRIYLAQQPEINYDWHGQFFLTYDKIFKNEAGSNLWMQLTPVGMSKMGKIEKYVEYNRIIENY